MDNSAENASTSPLEDAQKHFRAGRLLEAQKLCLSMIEDPATRGDGYYGLGLVAAKEAKQEEARNYFEKCLESAPQAVDAHLQLGKLLENSDRDAARHHFETALSLRPEAKGAVTALERLSATPLESSPATNTSSPQKSEDEPSQGRMFRLFKAVIIALFFGAVAYFLMAILPRNVLGVRIPSPNSSEHLLIASGLGFLALLILVRRALRTIRIVPDPFIELVRRDNDAMSEELVLLLERITFVGKPSLIAYLERILIWPAVIGILIAICVPLLLEVIGTSTPSFGADEVVILAVAVALLFAVTGLFRVLSLYISVRQGRIRIARGIFFRQITHIELPRITDVTVRRGPLGLITGHGAIVLSVGSDSERREELRGIKRGRALYNYAEDLRQATIALRASRWGRDVLVWR